MKFSPEAPWITGNALEQLQGSDRKRQMADVLGSLVGASSWLLGNHMERMTADLPLEARDRFFQEMEEIAQESGWKYATELLQKARNTERTVQRLAGVREDTRLYHSAVRRPDQLSDIRDFFPNKGEQFVAFWIPTKRDIMRCVAIAREAHEADKRTGPIRILEVGGGSGLLSRLLADELRAQQLEHEVIVVDPDEDVLREATNAHTDCPELHFERGTAKDALRRYGPKLDAEGQKSLRSHERAFAALKEDAREHLGRIEAARETLEAWTSLEEALATPFGPTIRTLLQKIEIRVTQASGPDLETIRERLTRYYNQEFDAIAKSCLQAKNRIEETYQLHGQTHEETPDLVLNSWMPSGIDFTRELRMIHAPAIVYAVERGGATGISSPDRSPLEVADESSYGAGRLYRGSSLEWEGLAGSGVASAVIIGHYNGSYNTRVFAHIRKDIPPPSEQLLDVDIEHTQRYAWEPSLEKIVGKETMSREQYSNPIDPYEPERSYFNKRSG